MYNKLVNCVILTSALFFTLCNALPLELFYPFSNRTYVKLLRGGDDISSNEIKLTTPISFYNETYSSLYINSNGHITFDTELPVYRPTMALPMKYKLVAAFLADIDTTETGFISYRETNDSVILKRTATDVRSHFANFREFDPSSAFIVTWFQVGYFRAKYDKLNTFQMVIVSGQGSSFCILNYLSRGLNWIKSEGKQLTRDINDPPAQAGFNSGVGRNYFKLPFSGTINIDKLASESNVAVPGTWIYQIGDVAQVRGPDFNTGEEFVFDVDKKKPGCIEGARTCHESAQCIDYKPGFCCECVPTFYGNGKACIKQGDALRLSGNVNIRITGFKAIRTDFHAYVLPKTGRSFIGISHIPETVGHTLKTLSPIGGSVGWLFAVVKNPRAKNGFMITGGKFNRTALVRFYSGERATITQTFYGQEIRNMMTVDTHVHGSLPIIPAGAKFTVDPYTESYKRVAPGKIKSYSSRMYRIDQKPFQYTWDDTILYEECSHDRSFSAISELKLFVTKNQALFDTKQDLIRFGMETKIGSGHATENPCTKDPCGDHGQCKPAGVSYICACRPGFHSLNGLKCTDIDECASEAQCDPNARCLNTPGSYQCQCLSGYRSNGQACDKVERMCGEFRCDGNARCVYDSQLKSPVCECNPGYYGDGTTCRKTTPQRACGEFECDEDAHCVYDSILKKPVCECKRGFSGDGLACLKAEFSCREVNNCHDNSECAYVEEEKKYMCVCREGFSGDGVTSCEDDNLPENSCKGCDAHAACLYDAQRFIYRCQCRHSYTGDGKTCTLIEECTRCASAAECVHHKDHDIYRCHCLVGYMGDGYTCSVQDCNVKGVCSPNAQCLENTDTGRSHCVCSHGYTGDGLRCKRVPCNQVNACHANAECRNDPRDPARHECVCESGYRGDGYTCVSSEVSCKEVNNCDSNAECLMHPETQAYVCRCKRGYRGDGRRCQMIEKTCKEVNNCDSNAECLMNPDTQAYACRCKHGYRGDGRRCQSTETSCNQVNNCDSNAECLYNPDAETYTCRCRRGYSGDGRRCQRKAQDCAHDRSLCDRNARCTVQRGRYACVCNPGFHGNGRRCRDIDSSETYLVFSQGSSLLQTPYVLTNDSRAAIPSKLLLYRPGETIVGLSYDCASQNIYWSDIYGRKINRAKTNGSDLVTILSDLGSPEGIAIDWISKNMYWTDSKLDQIEVSRLDGSNRKALIMGNLSNPRSIVVDPGQGVMFWTDWERSAPKIERSQMDGSERMVFVSVGLSLPNALTLDLWTQQLCWGDAGTQKIECMRTDGSGRYTVYSLASYPFSLTMAGQLLVWTDWRTKGLPNIDRAGGDIGEALPLPLGGHGNVYGITTIRATCPRVNNACALNNGGCGFLCLPTSGGGRTCACPDNMTPEQCEGDDSGGASRK